MSPPPDIHDLARQLAVLEERMNTLRADLTATLEGFRTDQARLREDIAKRETRLIFAMIATVAIGLTVFGFVTA